MKNIITIILFTITTLTSFATHLMGGQITSQLITGLTYEVTTTVYRDITGVAITNQALISYENTSIGYSSQDTVPVSPPINLGNGVEKYTYVDTVTFPVVGNYRIYFSNCCRNAAILNIVDPMNTDMYLDHFIEADLVNSSPIFLNDPVTLGQINVPFYYNPLPFDINGDSIVWVLDTPMTLHPTIDIGVPCVFSLPPSDTSMPFTLNSQTGEISFLPNVAGNFEISMKIYEYKNGVEIGYIRRDMQFIIVPSSNSPVIVNTNNQNTHIVDISAGQNLSLYFDANDPDNQWVTLSINGDIFRGQGAIPSYSIIQNSMSNVSSVLNWTPSLSSVRLTPHTLCYRVTDRFNNFLFSRDYTFQFRVNNIMNLDEITEKTSFTVFPNPMSTYLNVYFYNDEEGLKNIKIVDLQGKILYEKEVYLFAKNQNLIGLQNIYIENGVYFINLCDKNKTLATKMIFVR